MSTVAVIQMNSCDQIETNLDRAAELIALSAQKGAKLAVLPENFAFMGKKGADICDHAESEGQGIIQDFLSHQSSMHKIWLVGGTLPVLPPHTLNMNRVQAASILYNDLGEPVIRYDKIHLFDVTLEETGETYSEKSYIQAGNTLCVVDTPVGRLGMAVCYDLRFPELFRAMLDQGAELFCIPSAFTLTTGKAHWEELLRARAIENLSYVLAPNQYGKHPSGRKTYGHSMIVDPWGAVKQTLEKGSGILYADVSLDKLRALRKSFPCIDHRKLSCRFI